MGKGIDRTEFLRRDCKACNGNGYLNRGGSEVPCPACDGAGYEEKEVPFKFDGARSQEEINDIWNENTEY